MVAQEKGATSEGRARKSAVLSKPRRGHKQRKGTAEKSLTELLVNQLTMVWYGILEFNVPLNTV